MSQVLQGKTAIVTGAGSGIGEAIATLFAQEGANVVVNDYSGERVDRVVADLKARGYSVAPAQADVSKLDEMESIFAVAQDTFGDLDILVNNAGVMDDFTAAGNLTDDLWKRVFSINVDSVMYSTRLALKTFEEKKAGVILNIASVAGTNGARGGAAYVASKHAVLGFTENVAYMYGPDGIRCNAIAPGSIATDIGNTFKNIDQFGMGRIQQALNTTPKPGKPEEIAAAALFLCQDSASYVNGVTLKVDGAWTAF